VVALLAIVRALALILGIVPDSIKLAVVSCHRGRGLVGRQGVEWTGSSSVPLLLYLSLSLCRQSVC
jgi:hypothetical protein